MVDLTDLNVFAACAPCLRHAGKVMLPVVVALAGLTYWAVVQEALWPGLAHPSGVLSPLLHVVGLLAYTALVVMVLWCFLATFAADPGGVPPGWEPFYDEEELAPEEAGRLLAAAADPGRSYLERPRFCKKCQGWKPPRAHHCSMSGRCVLRMDHYCIWVANCVGLLNYKSFVLFLLYTMAACLASALLLLRPCVKYFKSSRPHVAGFLLTFMMFILTSAFTLALAGFAIMHLGLIAKNQTTIEAFEKRPVKPWPYDRGRRRNFSEVFGRGGARRFLPLHTPEEAWALLEAALARTVPPAARRQLVPPSPDDTVDLHVL